MHRQFETILLCFSACEAEDGDVFVDELLILTQTSCVISRYDDTNPEAEKKEYIDHIEEIVNWMGWKPFKVSFTCLIHSAFRNIISSL